jgi:hypothetical protein
MDQQRAKSVNLVRKAVLEVRIQFFFAFSVNIKRFHETHLCHVWSDLLVVTQMAGKCVVGQMAGNLMADRFDVNKDK